MKIIFADFGRETPTGNLKSIREHFPEAEFVLYSDKESPGFDTVHIVERLEDHPRQLWRSGNFYKAKGLLDAEGVAVAFDLDMWIVSGAVRSIIPLTEIFGMCLPMNPRWLMKIDAEIGADGSTDFGVTGGWGPALNCAIQSADSRNPKVAEVLKEVMRLGKHRPNRGPLTWWRALENCKFFPCLLPKQWCVCGEDEGIGNAIVIHVGHERVRKYYNLGCTP